MTKDLIKKPVFTAFSAVKPSAIAKTSFAKFGLSRQGDQYEQEADRVAGQVMQMPETSLQRQRTAKHEHLRPWRQEPAHGALISEAPPIMHEVLNTPGQPLDAQTRAFFEPRFGHDFSRVRVHIDPRAAESAQAVYAKAFTAGHHIVFSRDHYAPEAYSGRRLLAHELTHVIQQDMGMTRLIQCAPFPGETIAGESRRKNAIRSARWAIKRIEMALVRGYLWRTEVKSGTDIKDIAAGSTETTAQRANRLITLIRDLWNLVAELERGPIPNPWLKEYVIFSGKSRSASDQDFQMFYGHRMQSLGMSDELVWHNWMNLEDSPVPTPALKGKAVESSGIQLGIWLVVKDPKNRPQEWKRLTGFDPVDGYIVELSSDRYGYFYYWYGQKMRLPNYPNR